MNTSSSALSDARVRRAIASALDLESMIPQLLGDSAEPGRTFFAAGFGEYVSPKRYMPPFDLEAAKAMFAEAGWTPNAAGTLERDGTSLTLSLTVVANNSECFAASISRWKPGRSPRSSARAAPGRASSAASLSDSRLPIQELSVFADASTRRVKT